MELDEGDDEVTRDLEELLTIALIRLSTRDAAVAQQEDGSYPCRNGYNVLRLDDFERRELLHYEPDSNTLKLLPAGVDYGDRALEMLLTGLESGFDARPTPADVTLEAPKKPAPDNRILRLRIKLDLGDLPACWREIAIRADATFLDLHLAIQRIFSWNDEHLFTFDTTLPTGDRVRIDELDSTDLSFYDKPILSKEAAERPAHKVHLNGVFDGKQSMTYIYDLKTQWRHSITLAGIDDVTETDAPIPRLLAGAGDAPPEGVNDLDGYRRLLAILAGPRNAERAQTMKRLLSQNYRPFDLEAKARELADFFIHDRERWMEQLQNNA